MCGVWTPTGDPELRDRQDGPPLRGAAALRPQGVLRRQHHHHAAHLRAFDRLRPQQGPAAAGRRARHERQAQVHRPRAGTGCVVQGSTAAGGAAPWTNDTMAHGCVCYGQASWRRGWWRRAWPRGTGCCCRTATSPSPGCRSSRRSSRTSSQTRSTGTSGSGEHSRATANQSRAAHTLMACWHSEEGSLDSCGRGCGWPVRQTTERLTESMRLVLFFCGNQQADVDADQVLPHGRAAGAMTRGTLREARADTATADMHVPRPSICAHAGGREDDQGAAQGPACEPQVDVHQAERRQAQPHQEARGLPQAALRPLLLPRPRHRAQEVRPAGVERAVRVQRHRPRHQLGAARALCQPVRRDPIPGEYP